MHVLLVTNLFPTGQRPQGGAFVTRRVEALRAAGTEVTVVKADYRTKIHVARERRQQTPELRSSSADRDANSDSGQLLRVSDYARLRIGYSNRAVHRVSEHVDKLVDPSTYDVIQAHGMFAPPAGAVARRLAERHGTPYVVCLHGSDVRLATRRSERVLREVVGAADAAVFVSSNLRDVATGLGAAPSESIVIPNGVDVDLFKPRRAPGSDPQGRGSVRQAPVVGFVGSLTEVKRADRVPTIFRRMLAKNPKLRLTIVGDGSLGGRMRADMSGLPVDFVGVVEPTRVPFVMANLDLLLLPSRSEGWPCVVLEAHACGVPVLGSDAGGTGEAIGDPEMIVPQGPGFDERFADAAVKALTRAVDPSALRARALGFSWERLALRERGVLEAAIQRKMAHS